MWSNEKIFSVGDLCSYNDEYDEFIKNEHLGDLTDRYNHITEMIKRLNNEMIFIESVLEERKKEDLKNKVFRIS